MPATRTVTFVSKCVRQASVRPTFDIESHLPLATPIEPPVDARSHEDETDEPRLGELPMGSIQCWVSFGDRLQSSR